MIKRPLSQRRKTTGAAILAGALTFMGSAEAVTVFSEGFEGVTNVFSAPTYNYTANYTQANPGGGVKYMHGGPGITGSISSNTFTAATNPISLLTGGISAGAIDGGGVTFNLSAQFSTYFGQNDDAIVRVQFLNGALAPIGAPVEVGGFAFVSALGADGTGSRAWGTDTEAGLVPALARSVNISVIETKTAPGTVIDGYTDNILFSATVVPEASTSATALLAGGLFLFRRRRS